MTDLLARIRSGDVRAVARTLSLIERNESCAQDLLAALYPYSGHAHRIGITGPPGAGKSTLTGRLAACFRKAGKTVGILAVDITSPFSGGAILGDRIRMQGLASDPEVFIRSMGNGGLPGGLCQAAQDAVRVLEAMGKAIVLVETAGAGQTEVDVVHQVDTVVLVLAPEWGDEIQVLKAGILEIPDIIALNKSDRPGADILADELRGMGREVEDGWEVPLVQTVATEGGGVSELFGTLEAHRAYLETGDRAERKRRGQVAWELMERARERERLLSRLEDRLQGREFDALVDRVCRGEIDPYRAVEAFCL